MKVMFRVVTSGAPRSASISVIDSLRRDTSWDVDYKFVKTTHLLCGMNEVFVEARKKKVDFLIHSCDDLGIENPKSLEQLIQHNVPVVECLVPNWQLGHFYWNCYHLTENGIYYSDNPRGKHGLQQVYSGSMSLCCYRRDVLENPHLWPIENELHSDGTLKLFGGADTNLFTKLHRNNIPFFVDMDLIVEHTMPVRLKQSMDVLGVWIDGLVEQKWSPASGLPSCIRVNTRKLGVDLPACESYRRKWRTGEVPIIPESMAYPLTDEDMKRVNPSPKNATA